MNSIISIAEIEDISPPGERLGKYMSAGLTSVNQLLDVLHSIERWRVDKDTKHVRGIEIEVKQKSLKATIEFLDSIPYMTFLYRNKIADVYCMPLGDILMITVG